MSFELDVVSVLRNLLMYWLRASWYVRESDWLSEEGVGVGDVS